MSSGRKTPAGIPPAILSMEATKAVNFHRNDALVVSTSSALRDWSAVSQRRDLDVDLKDCMDRAPAVGLGLALAQPGAKVLVLDCDSTLRTDLGGLATVGESAPRNLVHLLFDDVAHRSTQGLPIPALDNVDFVSIAKSAGYAKTYEFDNLEGLVLGFEDVMAQEGPVFVLVKVLRDLEQLPMPERSMAEGWAEVRQSIAASG